MAYVPPGTRFRQEVRYEATNQKVTLWPEVDGQKVNPDAGAMVSIFQPGNLSTPIVGPTAATEDEATNELSYLLNASSATDFYLAENYRAQWDFTPPGGLLQRRTTVFDVVRQPLVPYIPLRVDDLKGAHAEIERAFTQQSVEATAHNRFIQPAWEDVLRWVTSKGRRPSLITPPEDLKGVVFYRALQKVCEFFSRAADDRWAKMAENYKKDFETAQQETTLHYDPSDSLNPATEVAWQQPKLLIGNDLKGGGNALGSLLYGRHRC